MKVTTTVVIRCGGVETLVVMVGRAATDDVDVDEAPPTGAVDPGKMPASCAREGLRAVRER